MVPLVTNVFVGWTVEVPMFGYFAGGFCVRDEAQRYSIDGAHVSYKGDFQQADFWINFVVYTCIDSYYTFLFHKAIHSQQQSVRWDIKIQVNIGDIHEI